MGELSNLLCNYSPQAMTILASSIANALSEGLNANEANALGTLITTIGGALQQISAQMIICQQNDSDGSNMW